MQIGFVQKKVFDVTLEKPFHSNNDANLASGVYYLIYVLVVGGALWQHANGVNVPKTTTKQ